MLKFPYFGFILRLGLDLSSKVSGAFSSKILSLKYLVWSVFKYATSIDISSKRAVKRYSYLLRIACDKSAVSLLTSREQRYIRAINNNLLYPSDKTCFGKAIVPLKREFSVFRSLSAGLWRSLLTYFYPAPVVTGGSDVVKSVRSGLWCIVCLLYTSDAADES